VSRAAVNCLTIVLANGHGRQAVNDIKSPLLLLLLQVAVFSIQYSSTTITSFHFVQLVIACLLTSIWLFLWTVSKTNLQLFYSMMHSNFT